MAKRHIAIMEGGGWILLVTAIVAVIYFIFFDSGRKLLTSVSATVAPTAGLPKMTPELADSIASGTIAASLWKPGDSCSGGFNLFDAGNGTVWCVFAPVPPGMAS